MGQAIGGALPLAVGIALSPLPIIAVVLMLTGRARGQRHGIRPGLAGRSRHRRGDRPFDCRPEWR